MFTDKTKELGAKLIKAQHDFNNKKIDQLSFSKQVEAIESEGQLLNICKNSIANYAMNEYGSFVKQESKRAVLHAKVQDLHAEYRTGAIMENHYAFKLEEIKKQAAADGIVL